MIDQRIAAAINGLKRDAAFDIFISHLKELLERDMKALVSANDENYRRVQGRAQILSELLKDIEGSDALLKNK